MPKLLITGITGLIGGSVLRKILADNPGFQITALVRPSTPASRWSEFSGRVETSPLDLADTDGLREFLWANEFDAVLHIGALRGGRKFSREEYLRANLSSTEQIAEYCLARGAKLVFCSSVGVFGAIPEELPAGNATERNADNFYHYTKIEAEKVIGRAVLKGLNAGILRPSITYGKGDYGFPYQLVKLVSRKRFPLISKRIWIHLCHIDTITAAFDWMLRNQFTPGLALNVADREPVQLHELVNFISRQTRGANYPKWISFDKRFFRWGEWLAQKLKNELWVSRFQLISRSWFYSVSETFDLMRIPETYTIPGIQITISDYQEK